MGDENQMKEWEARYGEQGTIMCISIYNFVCIYVYMYIYLCMYIHIYVYICIYMYMYAYMNIYICIYIYIYMHTWYFQVEPKG